jgi:hypothetical protein
MATAMAALIVDPNASLSVLGDRASRSTHARTCCRGARGASRSVRQPLCRFRFIAAAARGSRGGTLCAVRRRIVNGDDGCVLFVRRCRAEPVHAACCMLHVARCRLMLHAMWCGSTSRALADACRAAPLAATPSPVERTDGMAGAQVRAPLFCLQPSALHRRARLSCCCVGVHPTDMPCSTVARCDVGYATRQQLLSVRGSAVGCDGRLLDCSSRGFSPCDRSPHRPLPCSLFNRPHCALPWAGWVGSTVRSLSTAR